MSAFEGSGGSHGWLARHGLMVFLVLPLVVYATFALTHGGVAGVASLATALTALLVCWVVGERQDRPARSGLRVLAFALVSAVYAVGLLVPEYGIGHIGVARLAWPYLPLAFVAGLLVQGLLSPNAGLRRLAQPLLRWRAPWHVYAIALFALPLLAVLVVWLSRHLPGAAAETADGDFVATALRAGWFAVLVMGPWALAWFGYGVPMLLRRRSALVTALTLGFLTWLHEGISMLFSSYADWPEALLNLGAVLAVAVLAVWLFQRARGSIWPLLILEGTTAVVLLLNWAGDGFGDGDHSTWAVLVAAEAAFAVLFVVIGRMWEQPELSQPATKAMDGNGGILVEEHC